MQSPLPEKPEVRLGDITPWLAPVVTETLPRLVGQGGCGGCEEEELTGGGAGGAGCWS